MHLAGGATSGSHMRWTKWEEKEKEKNKKKKEEGVENVNQFGLWPCLFQIGQ